MRKPILALFGLAISLFGTQCWAQENCSPGEGSVSCTFSPGITRGVFDFTGTGDGRLVVQFDTVITTFTLTVTFNHDTPVFAEGAFPAGTTCVPYGAQNGNRCDQYDFNGTGGHGLNGLPLKNTDYKRLITLTLSYFAPPLVGEPAFGHAPGDANTTFSEDILTNYSSFPPCTVSNGCIGDPTMGGKTPGLSRVVALNKPLAETGDTFCLVSPHEGDSFTVGQQIEVEFRLFAGGVCPNTAGTPLPDKTARLSVSTVDSGNNVIFPRLRNKEQGNKFHFDGEDGVNEFDLSTHKLLPGHYTITIFSSKFSSQDVGVNIIAGTDTDDDPD
jgi:hypothetical protein